MMLRKPPPQKPADQNEREKRLLTLELAEIQEISEILFRRLEQKMQTLQALEQSLDRKVAQLERLSQAGVSVGEAAADMGKQSQVSGLARRGMQSPEIAELLHMPVGEVELILALNRQNA